MHRVEIYLVLAVMSALARSVSLQTQLMQPSHVVTESIVLAAGKHSWGNFAQHVEIRRQLSLRQRHPESEGA